MSTSTIRKYRNEYIQLLSSLFSTYAVQDFNPGMVPPTAGGSSNLNDRMKVIPHRHAMRPVP